MSWTVDFFKEWIPRMTPLSAWRYRGVLLREHAGTPHNDQHVSLNLKQPFRADITLREGSTDLCIFDEVLYAQVYACVQQHVPECKTIIDVGANIGLATLYFSSIYPDAKILSVEPVASNFSLLQMNTAALKRQKRSEIINAAVWSHDGELSLGSSRPGGHDLYQFVEDPTKPQKVQALSMQSIYQRSGFQEVDLLKVDVEGAEVQLLQGDLSWLDHVNAMAVEFHGNSRLESNFDQIMQDFRIIDASSHTTLAIRKVPGKSTA
jgi:FkbM family methyltransferase